MKIWRVENPNGEGPYQSYFDYYDNRESYIRFSELKSIFREIGFCGETDLHPVIPSDIQVKFYNKINTRHHHIFFGCSSIEQLRKWWFYPELNAFMAEHNFKVVCYECEDRYAYSDEFQAMFHKDRAKKISEHDIGEILEIMDSLEMAA